MCNIFRPLFNYTGAGWLVDGRWYQSVGRLMIVLHEYDIASKILSIILYRSLIFVLNRFFFLLLCVVLLLLFDSFSFTLCHFSHCFSFIYFTIANFSCFFVLFAPLINYFITALTFYGFYCWCSLDAHTIFLFVLFSICSSEIGDNICNR